MKKTYRINQVIYIPHDATFTFEADEEEFLSIMGKLSTDITHDDLERLGKGENIEVTSADSHYPVLDIANEIFHDNADIEASSWADWRGDKTFMVEELKGEEDGSVAA